MWFYVVLFLHDTFTLHFLRSVVEVNALGLVYFITTCFL